MSDGATEAYATVCERAVRLLGLLRPWAANGPEVNGACVDLTLALAAVPVEAPHGEGEEYPLRRVSLGLSDGGEMHVSIPGQPDEPVDERTLEALRSIGEAALAKMRTEAEPDG